MKLFLKIIFVLILLDALVMYIIVNHSAIETQFKCKGVLVNQHSSEFTPLYVKMLRYRFWVNLWADTDGSMSVEIPEIWTHFYSKVRNEAAQYQMMNSQGGVEGVFSDSNDTFALVTPYGFFNGTCKEIK